MLLKDLAIFRNGKSIPICKANVQSYPIYGSTGFIGNANDFLIDQNCIVIGRVGANCGYVNFAIAPAWVTDNCIIVQNKDCYIKYLYYLLKTMNLNQYHIGSAQPLLTSDILKTLKCVYHNKEEQRHIVNNIFKGGQNVG